MVAICLLKYEFNYHVYLFAFLDKLPYMGRKFSKRFLNLKQWSTQFHVKDGSKYKHLSLSGMYFGCKLVFGTAIL